MPINSKHPSYAAHASDWQRCRHAYRGERQVKGQRTTYLPATPGHVIDGMASGEDGRVAYDAYLERAVFHEFVSEAVETMIGLMWAKPPVIEVPTVMEPFLERASLSGENATQLLRRINEQQLVAGRVGIMADLPAEASLEAMPYLATYMAEHLINWGQQEADGRTDLIVLDESGHKRVDEFEWDAEERYRVLRLNPESGKYETGLFKGENLNFNEAEMLEPSMRGNIFEDVPFHVANSKDVILDPDDPPLLGLVNLAYAIYRGEADYRQTLFMQSQDTLVTIGMTSDDDVRVGAGSAIHLPSGQGHDAKYIGVSSDGLGEQRQALENDKMLAAQKAGQLVDNRSQQKESGDALRIRMGAQTATLNQVALSGGEALRNALQSVAKIYGADPEQVIVEPNTDFENAALAAEDLVKLITAKTLGAPLSRRTIHNIMRRRELTELEYEEELDEIDEEEPLSTGLGEEEDDEGNEPDPTDDPEEEEEEA